MKGERNGAIHSQTLGGCDSGNALKIVVELDVLKAGILEERFDLGHLAEAEFECEVSAWYESGVRLWNEAAVYGEAVVAAEEGDVRLVFQDFDGDQGAIFVRDIGRIGDDDFELLSSDRGEEIALKESDMIGKPDPFGIPFCNLKCGIGDVDRGNISFAPVVRNTDGNAT